VISQGEATLASVPMSTSLPTTTTMANWESLLTLFCAPKYLQSLHAASDLRARKNL